LTSHIKELPCASPTLGIYVTIVSSTRLAKTQVAGTERALYLADVFLNLLSDLKTSLATRIYVNRVEEIWDWMVSVHLIG
jgi:hypothetical protein